MCSLRRRTLDLTNLVQIISLLLSIIFLSILIKESADCFSYFDAGRNIPPKETFRLFVKFQLGKECNVSLVVNFDFVDLRCIGDLRVNVGNIAAYFFRRFVQPLDDLQRINEDNLIVAFDVISIFDTPLSVCR